MTKFLLNSIPVLQIYLESYSITHNLESPQTVHFFFTTLHYHSFTVITNETFQSAFMDGLVSHISYSSLQRNMLA